MTVTAALLGGGLALFSVGVVAPASAAPSEWHPYHFEYGGADGLNEDFCGVTGLTVQQEGVVDGRERYVAHGSDGLPYYYDHATAYTDTWTNVATGDFVTVEGSYRGASIRVTDNGDGTYTVLFQYNGVNSYYNEDGQRIAHEAGLIRAKQLFDDAGTPTDPSDDEMLAFLGFVKRTGQNDDLFCTTIVQAIG
ncbi:MAG: hypothetical protein H0V21_09365 [Rubrobacter sp.]|nr:hypothetical protein [Rubrobacter sp.]